MAGSGFPSNLRFYILAKTDPACSYGSKSVPTFYFRIFLVELWPIQQTRVPGDCQDMSHELEGCKQGLSVPLKIRFLAESDAARSDGYESMTTSFCRLILVKMCTCGGRWRSVVVIGFPSNLRFYILAKTDPACVLNPSPLSIFDFFW